MIGDDLVPLLAPPAGPDVGFRQGVIVAFNQSTGANTVNVGGADLDNLPILSGSESLEYAPGDVVVLIRLKSSLAILGRIVTPDTGAILAPSAVAFAADTQQDTGFALNTFSATPGANVKATATLPVPPWANRAAVLATAIVVGKQPTTPVPAGSVMTTQVTIDGQTDANKPQGWVHTENTVVSAYPSLTRVLDVTPGGTITCTVEAWASGSWGVNSSNYARIHALGMFSREA